MEKPVSSASDGKPGLPNGADIAEQAHGLPEIERYEIIAELGRGGMAVAHEVKDKITERQVALKTLLPCDKKDALALRALFEAEYHSLSQLAHPRIVEAYDYGHDSDGHPYYTMELLDGGDLREMAPMAFNRVCAVMADVCSALSLIHSRRLLHSDLTPRNVRCTRDGKAKLIDFGAVTAFGPSKRIVGTPPFCPPEAVTGQDLDGRSDLYALGATAYFALTKRHAFPAKNFTALKDLWRAAIRPPSAYVDGIPRELDQLIMSLLQLERGNRPENAAEVIERLSAIVDFDSSEQQIITRSYLAAPNLAGRDSSLLRVKKTASLAMDGCGAALLITSDSGMGRSRFLSACALEGKLLGATVLRIDATDAGNGAFSASRALLVQLLDAMPECPTLVTPDEAKILSTLSTRFIPGPESAPVIDGKLRKARETLTHKNGPEAARSAMQSALLNVVHASAERRPLIVTVDDVDMLDEPSQALFALLAPDAKDHALLIIASAHNEAMASASGALQVFKNGAGRMGLGPISETATHDLLSSVVGQVERLTGLTEHLHNITRGVPAHIIHLTEQLVDAGHLTYQAGEWNISPEATLVELPNSLSEALTAKLKALDPATLHLAQLMALVPDKALTAQDLASDDGRDSKKLILKALDDLVAEDIAGTDGSRYRLRHRSMQKPLVDSIDAATHQILHKQLAELFTRCGDRSTRVFYHLASAGDLEGALHQVLEQAKTAEEDSRNDDDTMDLAADRPGDIQAVLELLLKYCKDNERSCRDAFAVQTTLVAYCSLSTGSVVDHICAVLEQLRHDSGLDLYESLRGTVPEEELLGKTFEAAQARYDNLGDDQRVMAPFDATKQLARNLVRSLAIFGARFDYDRLEGTPSLAPFAGLSPALEVIHKNATASLHLLGGRYAPAKKLWLEVIERLNAEDRAQIPEARHRYMQLAIYHAIGSLDGGLCRTSSMANLHLLDADPVFQVNAELLRMNYAFRMGNVEVALKHRDQAELIRLKNTSQQMFAGTHLYVEATSYALIRDTRRLKRILPELKDAAARMPQWEPILHLARGSYMGLRKRYDEASIEFKRALHLTAPGRHLAWPNAAAGVIHTLRRQERVDAACEQGEAFLQQAIDAEIDHVNTIREALAFSQSAAGNHEAARKTIDRTIAGWQNVDASGPLLGVAFETAALIAMAQGDEEAFSSYARQCGALFRTGGNAILTARHDSLHRRAHARAASPKSPEKIQSQAPQFERSTSVALSHFQGEEGRIAYCTKLIAQRCNAPSMCLFLLREEGPILSATHGNCTLPESITQWATDFLRAKIDETTEDTTTDTTVLENGDIGSPAWIGAEGVTLVPVLLIHEDADSTLISGVAIAFIGPETRPNTPHRLLADISRALTDFGDAVPASISF